MPQAVGWGGTGEKQTPRLETAEDGKVLVGAVAQGDDGGGRRVDFTGSLSPLSMYNALSLARGISGVSEGEAERE